MTFGDRAEGRCIVVTDKENAVGAGRALPVRPDDLGDAVCRPRSFFLSITRDRQDILSIIFPAI